MRKIGFVGVYDKTDTLLYTAKILKCLQKRVLVIDSCKMQKVRYVVPSIAPTVNYVTTFEGFDIAVGFQNMNQIKGYLGKTYEEELDYDIVLIDVDSIENFNGFEIELSDNLFFATGFDLYTLKKGLEILYGLSQPVPMTKMLFANKVLKQDNEYLDFLAKDAKIVWNENIINILTSDMDNLVFAENQRVARLKYKNLSANFKESLATIVMTIVPGLKINEVVKTLKTIDKGV